MKHSLIKLSLVFLAFAFSTVDGPITGHWIHKNSNGDITEKLEFRNDGTFEAFLTTENYRVGGKYKLDKNTMLMSDTGCNAKYWGRYTISYQGRDSITPSAIDDTCTGRKMSADKMLFTRE